MVLDHRETDDLEFVLELRLVQHGIEDLRHMFGRIVKRTASPGSEDDGIMAVDEADAQHGADLPLRRLHGPGDKASLRVEVGTVDRGHGHDRTLERRVDELVALTLARAEESHAAGIDAARIAVHRIGAVALRQTEESRMIIRILIERDTEIALAEERLLLGACTVQHTAAWRVSIRHVQHDRVVALGNEVARHVNAVGVDRVEDRRTHCRLAVHTRRIVVELARRENIRQGRKINVAIRRIIPTCTADIHCLLVDIDITSLLCIDCGIMIKTH